MKKRSSDLEHISKTTDKIVEDLRPKHTPGPWLIKLFVNEKTKETGFGVGADPDRLVVAWVYQASPNKFGNVVPSQLPAEANARLIAVAPELLEIAKAYRNFLRTMAQSEGEIATFHHIESIVAKAEGLE